MQLTPAPEKMLGCWVIYGQTQSLSLKMQFKKIKPRLGFVHINPTTG